MRKVFFSMFVCSFVATLKVQYDCITSSKSNSSGKSSSNTIMNWVILAEIWDSERIDVVVETRPRDDHLAASMSECWTSTIGEVH